VEKGTPGLCAEAQGPGRRCVGEGPGRNVKRDPDAVEHGVPVKVNEEVQFVKVNAWSESVNLNEYG